MQGRLVLDSPVNNACSHYLHNMFYVLGDRLDRSDQPKWVTAELYRQPHRKLRHRRSPNANHPRRQICSSSPPTPAKRKKNHCCTTSLKKALSSARRRRRRHHRPHETDGSSINYEPPNSRRFAPKAGRRQPIHPRRKTPSLRARGLQCAKLSACSAPPSNPPPRSTSSPTT